MVLSFGKLDLRLAEQAIASGAQRALCADGGLVGLCDDRGQITLRAVSGCGLGQSPAPISVLDTPLTGERGSQDLLLAAGPHPAGLGDLAHWASGRGARCTLVAPMTRHGSVIGLIGVMFRQRRTALGRHRDVLERVAMHAALAVENARLHEQIRGSAALQERERLAREIHDGVAQSLSYVHFKTALTRDLLSSGNVEAAERSLLELEQVVLDYHTEIREDMYGLRAAGQLRRGFVEAVIDFAGEFSSRHAIEVRVEFGGHGAFEPDAEAAVQLLRIVQEALANVRRHSRANRATILIDGGREPTLVVGDNGSGFDLTLAQDGCHFGLQVMRERSAGLGGSLEITSSPGHGTEVRVLIPVCRVAGGAV